MISARRVSIVLAQKVIETYHAVLTTIQDARLPWRYQALSQDALSSNTHLNAQSGRKRSGKFSVYIAGLLCVFTALAVFSRGHGILSTLGLSRTNMSKERFIAAVLSAPVEGLLDLDPIRKKCNETKFQEGLVWHCAAVVGGIGNVGNMWLNCVRYAIEAGGKVSSSLFI
jgi:hypothetical protein